MLKHLSQLYTFFSSTYLDLQLEWWPQSSFHLREHILIGKL